jgi:uncharacterized protein YdhG (YjbR/CyaY superfamily)
MPERKATKKATPRKAASGKASAGFTAEEKAAMRERARELKAEARAGRDRAAGEKDLLAKLAELPKADRALGQKIHDIVTKTAPELAPRTWYGMPAYARDGKVVCYFTPASKFKERYSTFGFNASANLDDGRMWPTSFAVTKLTAAEERRIAALVKKAVS